MTRKEAIRVKCLDCCAGSRVEVRRCDNEDCSLWPYRLGTHTRINSDVKTTAKRGVLGAISEDRYQDT